MPLITDDQFNEHGRSPESVAPEECLQSFRAAMDLAQILAEVPEDRNVHELQRGSSISRSNSAEGDTNDGGRRTCATHSCATCSIYFVQAVQPAEVLAPEKVINSSISSSEIAGRECANDTGSHLPLPKDSFLSALERHSEPHLPLIPTHVDRSVSGYSGSSSRRSESCSDISVRKALEEALSRYAEEPEKRLVDPLSGCTSCSTRSAHEPLSDKLAEALKALMADAEGHKPAGPAVKNP